jgi:hypothetical protein
VTSSATPEAEGTPTPFSGLSSAGGSWRSAQTSRDHEPVTAESAEIETAVKGREAAEQAAHEQAFQARIEAQRRTVAEQLATETVEQMAAAEADARAQELATSLEEARAALLEQTKATLAAEQARSAAPPPAPPQPAAPRAAPAPRPPEPRIQPDGVPELVEFRSPSSSAVITVLLGIGALVAAGIAIYEASTSSRPRRASSPARSPCCW